MNLLLEPVPQTGNATLRRLLELYIYDFSDFWPSEISDEGLYIQEEYFSYLCSDKVARFFIKVDGKLAGFAILAFESSLTKRPVSDLLYFFVLRVYRRSGIGRVAAKELFAMFPGEWEVREAIENAVAIKFWRSVISEFTNGAFTDEHIKNENWDGPVQRFVSA